MSVRDSTIVALMIFDRRPEFWYHKNQPSNAQRHALVHDDCNCKNMLLPALSRQSPSYSPRTVKYTFYFMLNDAEISKNKKHSSIVGESLSIKFGTHNRCFHPRTQVLSLSRKIHSEKRPISRGNKYMLKKSPMCFQLISQADGLD